MSRCNSVASVHRRKISNSLSDSNASQDQENGQFVGAIASSRTCSASSMISSRPASQMSNISGYEDELLMLNKFLPIRSNGQITPNGYDSGNFSMSDFSRGESNKRQIAELQNNLEQAKREIEIYKSAVVEMRKRVELESNLKHNEDWKEKEQLIIENETLKISVRNTKNELIEKTKENDVLQEKIQSCERDINVLSQDLNKITSASHQLSWQLTEKCKANDTLKEDLKKQFMTSQEFQLQNRLLTNQLEIKSREMETLEKSQNWYKSELHICQQARADLQENLLTRDLELSKMKSKIERLQNENQHIFQRSTDIEKQALREKEALLRRLERISNPKNLSDIKTKEELSYLLGDVQQSTNVDQKAQIEELTKELMDLRATLETQFEEMKSVEAIKIKQHSNLIMREKEIDDLKVTINIQDATIERLTREKEKNDELIQIKMHDLREKTKVIETLELRLDTATNQQLQVNNVSETLRQQFHLITNRWLSIRGELKNRERDLEIFEKENSEIRKSLNEKEINFLYATTVFQNKIEELEQKLKINGESKNIKLLHQAVQTDGVKMCSVTTSTPNLSNERKVMDNKETQANFTMTESISCKSPLPQSPSPSLITTTSSNQVHFKTLIKVLESEHREKLKRYEINIRTLLRKVKEHMRGRKLAEQRAEAFEQKAILAENVALQLQILQDDYQSNERRFKELERFYDDELMEKSKIKIILKQICPNDETSIIQTANFVCREYIKMMDRIRKYESEISNIIVTKTQNPEIESLLKKEKKLLEKIRQKDEEMAGLINKVDTLECTFEEMEISKGLFEKAICNKDKDIQMMISRIEELDREIENEQSNSTSQNNKIVTLESEIKLHQQEIEMLQSKLRRQENIEKVLQQSKQQLLTQINSLSTELSAIQNEKIFLQNHATELRNALTVILNKESSTPSLSSSAATAPTPTTMSPFSWITNKNYKLFTKRTDFSRAFDILQKSAEYNSNLNPLQECVESLKREMDTLNNAIRQNSQFRCEVSLLDELEEIENGISR